MVNEIAVLIPVYQNQSGLEKTLSSVRGENVDIFIVDDGSVPPVTVDAYRAWFPVLKLCRLEQNRGITSALNEGLGEILRFPYSYIARLDAGDVCLPARFEKQRAFLEQNPDCVLIGGQVKFVDQDGIELWRENFPTTDDQIRRTMHSRNCFIHSAVMMRTSALKQIGGYRLDYPAAEDYELFMRLTRHYTVANLAEFVIKCEINPSGISFQNRRRQVLSRIKVMIKYFDPRLKESYLGILKNLFLLVAPYPMVIRMKSKFKDRRGWL